MANIHAHSLILGRYACSVQARIMLFVLSDVYIILPEHNLQHNEHKLDNVEIVNVRDSATVWRYLYG